MSPLILLLLVVLVIAAMPAWPYSRGWGYFPSGGIGLLVLVLAILMFSGRV